MVILQAVERKTPCSRTIFVFRIICYPNKERRKNGEVCQYTIRILPSFCIPWGRHEADKVATAIDYHTDEQNEKNPAAWVMRPEASPKVFKKYLQRAQERVSSWPPSLVTFLTATLQDNHWSQSLPRLDGDKFRFDWEQFKELVFLIAGRLDILPGEKYPENPYGYCLAIIGQNVKALGP